MPKKKPTDLLVRNDYTSTTDPNSPNAVPAFDDAVGLPQRPGRKPRPIVVDKDALAEVNAKIDPKVLKHQIEVANVVALYDKKALRPDEIAALRRRMFEIVVKSTEDVEQVLMGNKVWGSVQTRLYSILTERVMSKLSTITVEDNSAKKLEDLSIEELEALALGKKKAQAIDAVVKEGKALEEKAVQSEAISAGKQIKQLSEVVARGEAEQNFHQRMQEDPTGKKPSALG